MPPDETRWQRRLDRERAARKAAEELLRRKSGELFDANVELSETLDRTRSLQERMNLALWGSGERLWEWLADNDQFTYTELAGTDQPHRVRCESGLELRERLHPDDMLAYVYEWNALLFGMADQIDTQFRVLEPDGEWKWVRQVGRAIERDDSRLAQRIAGTEKDISQYREDKRNLRLFANAFDNASEGMSIITADGRVLHANRNFEKLLQVTAGEVVGRPFSALTAHIAEPERIERIFAEVEASGSWGGELDWRAETDGRSRSVMLRVTGLSERGANTHFVVIVSDMTERRQFEDQLIKLAHFDALTGLANRAHFTERLAATLAGCGRGDPPVAVLFMDLDRFKQINDSYGHASGDELLKTMARRLQAVIRASDLAGRWGGDEFVVMISHMHDGRDALRVAQKIREELLRTTVVGDVALTITGSIGVAVWPDDGRSAEQLIKHADSAMYQAKSRGRNCVHLYNPDIGENARRALELETSLRTALEHDELQLAWQPRVNVQTGRISGAEALLRWHSRELGPVSPGQFIPVAEDTGLIVPFGRWVLNEAVEQLRCWSEAGLSGMHASVNVSPKQLQDSDLVADVEAALKTSGIDPTLLELELTESCLLEDIASTIETLTRLRGLGVGIAVDDFGTGYSSLSYLMNLPLSVLKVDRQFTTQIGVDSRGEAIVETILALARNLGMRVVAEGVENDEQLHYLAERGCDEVQGFLLFRPLPLVEIDHHLADPLLRPEPKSATHPPLSDNGFPAALAVKSLQ